MKLSTENKGEKENKPNRNINVFSSVTKDQGNECGDLDGELNNIINGGGIDGEISKNEGVKLAPDVLSKDDANDG